jgi:hypothetical protein
MHVRDQFWGSIDDNSILSTKERGEKVYRLLKEAYRKESDSFLFEVSHGNEPNTSSSWVCEGWC